MLRQFLSKRILIAIAVISLVLSTFAIWQTVDSYAEDLPTTVLVQVGANKKNEDVHWDLCDENNEYQQYKLGTSVDRIIGDYGPAWAILKTDLEECGVITKIALSKEVGTELVEVDFIEAKDKKIGLQSTDFDAHCPDDDPNFALYSLAEDHISPSMSDHDGYDLVGIVGFEFGHMRGNEYFEIISAAQDEPYDDYNHVITLYFNGAEDAPAIPEEVQAVIEAIDAIGEITSENYLDKESGITAARDAFDALVTNELKEQVTNYNTLTDAEAAFDAFKLAAAKTAAISDLEEAFDKTHYSGEELAKLNQAIEDGKTAINAATSEDAITVAKNNALNEARKAKTDAQIAEEALQKAKDDAKKEIDDKYDLTQYSGDEKAKIEKAIADAKSAIDEAESIEAVTQAKNSGITEADKAKTDKEIADEKNAEIAKKKATAKKYTIKGLKVKAKSRKFTVSWKKTAGATGYQVQYKLKSAKKYKTLKTLKKLKVTSKKLKKGKKYQFKVRTYTTVKGTKVYGKWSFVKTCKCK